MGGAVSTIKHGFDSAVHGVEHAASSAFHDVKKGVQWAGHAAQSAEKEVSHLASDADHVVTTVGGKIASAVKVVPLIGDDLSKGVLGATDLVHHAVQNGEDLAHAAFHPVDAINTVVHNVEHPGELLDTAKHVGRMFQSEAKDVSNVVGAVKAVAPEFAPELGAVQGVAGLVAHPSLKNVLNAATSFAPDSTALKNGIKLVKMGQKGYKTYKIAKGVVQNPTVGGVLNAANQLAPGGKLGKALKYANMAHNTYNATKEFVEKPTLAGALSAARTLAPKNSRFGQLAQKAQKLDSAANQIYKHPTLSGILGAASVVAPKGSKFAKAISYANKANEAVNTVKNIVNNPSVGNAVNAAMLLHKQFSSSKNSQKKSHEMSHTKKKFKARKGGGGRKRRKARADGAFEDENVVPDDVTHLFEDPIAYHNALVERFGSANLMHHFIKEGVWIGSVGFDNDNEIKCIWYPVREEEEQENNEDSDTVSYSTDVTEWN